MFILIIDDDAVQYMDGFIDGLFAHSKENRCRARVVSIDHLPALQKEIGGLREGGLLNREFHQERLNWLRFQVPESLPGAKSVIAVAVPTPQTRAVFTLNGRRCPLTIPPTYTAYDATEERIEKFLTEALSERGCSLARTALPLKLLAVRSGLGQYGRNNICYVPDMGSFIQLVAFYSDVPCEEGNWHKAAVMESCKDCDLCRRACPAAAIPSDRFLLRAERCISYHNEKKGDIPFPAWMDNSWHNCVVGCMHCQRVCPQNRELIQWFGAKEEFTEEETLLILKGTSRDELQPSTLGKLERLSLLDYFGALPRNLTAVLNKP